MAEREILDLEAAAAKIIEEVPHSVIGSRVRRERVSQGLSIRALAKAANLGINSIVRLESGSGFRQMTLVKVCAALGIHLDRIASAGNEAVAVHRRADDQWHELDSYAKGVLLSGTEKLGPMDRKAALAGTELNPLMLLQSRLATGKMLPTLIELHHPTKPRSHPGEEFVFVLRGPVCVTVSGTSYVLETGESIEFWGTEPHSYAPRGDIPGLVLSIRVSP
ncbi:MAG: helix-turn-helix transcriptional regulator [Armatimonadetes bacterium]|nr:helix-turn-helix transcriptional regulator [Armatimonadota bacterium]